MDTITVPYDAKLATRLMDYFSRNVFYKGGHTFKEWLASQGATLSSPGLQQGRTITFEDSRQYTMFMLKYSA